MNDLRNPDLACVDPKVGEHVLSLGTPELGDKDRAHLEAHVEVCAYCRMALDLHDRFAKRFREHTPIVDLPHRSNRGSGGDWNWAGWSAMAAVAASLICLWVLPPRPVGPMLVERGPDTVRFLSPVEGQVVHAQNLTITWTEVPGVESYRVRISSRSNDFSIVEESRETTLEFADLTPGGEYRALLSTVPADLLPPGGASVRFRTGGLLAVATYRVRRTQPVTYWLALAGIAMGVIYLIGRATTPSIAGQQGISS